MSVQDRIGICKILNRTNYRVLAWYFGPDDTIKSGLTNFKFVMRMPMQSTGKEKFSVYMYIKEGQSISQKKRSKKWFINYLKMNYYKKTNLRNLVQKQLLNQQTINPRRQPI